MTSETVKQSLALLEAAYMAQMEGDLEQAVTLYKESLAHYPTAEAHTFLGWTYSFQGRLNDAIAECKKAIEVDPDFGNPYNDIGAYLIEMGRDDEAIPWLEKAIKASRYECYHYAHFNLGRVYYKKGMLHKAEQECAAALACYPEYTIAKKVLEEIQLQLN